MCVPLKHALVWILLFLNGMRQMLGHCLPPLTLILYMVEFEAFWPLGLLQLGPCLLYHRLYKIYYVQVVYFRLSV